MRELDTILGRKLATAVEVNGLFVPTDTLTARLSRFARPALFLCDENLGFEFSKAGSLFCCKFKESYFALTTQHQLQKEDYETDQLGIVDTTTNKISTSSQVSFAKEEDSYSEDLDAICFDFSSQVQQGNLSRIDWFSISDLSHQPDHIEALYVVIGYPSGSNEIDYEAKDYQAKSCAVWSKATNSNLTGRMAVAPINSIEYEPAGMSGGPIFSFRYSEGKFVALWAGLITEASQSIFHYLPTHRLIPLLDKHLNCPPNQK